MPAVMSDDALNRYRIVQPDKDLRALCRRLHRLPQNGSSSANGSTSKSAIAGLGDYGEEEAEEAQNAEREREREMARIEVLKWKINVERLMASARNLGRQGERYRLRAEETCESRRGPRSEGPEYRHADVSARQAAALEATLEDEKRLLAAKLKERDHMIRCDAVYAKITARPKAKEELNDHIITLRAQIEAHRTSHATYLEIVNRRIEAFSAITPIVDDVKTIKLPIEATADIPDEPIEIDDPPAKEDEAPVVLSSMALPFQPSSSPSSSSTSAPRNNGIAPPTAPARATSHALPHRPSRGSPAIPTAPSAVRTAGSAATRATSASLPQRPSALRSSTTPGRGLLEEGEVEGEEGEVDDRKGGRGGRRR